MRRDPPFKLTGGECTAAEFVAEAREWMGTPYEDYGRTKGAACDCIGLPVCVGQGLGLWTGGFKVYTSTPSGRHSERVADANMAEIVWTAPGWGIESDDQPSKGTDMSLQPLQMPHAWRGCIGLFWYANRDEPHHFAILDVHPDGQHMALIHCDADVGKVCDNRADRFWTKRLVKVYRPHGVKS